MSDYFETMGIPIVQGRSFQPTDAASAGRCSGQRNIREHVLDGQNPIGLRLRRAAATGVPWYTVIGVARDVKQGGVDQETGTELYFFVEQTERVRRRWPLRQIR